MKELLKAFNIVPVPITNLGIDSYIRKNMEGVLYDDPEALIAVINWLLLATYRTYGPESGALQIGRMIDINLNQASTDCEALIRQSPTDMRLPIDLMLLDELLRLRTVLECSCEEGEISENYLTALCQTIDLLHGIWWREVSNWLLNK